VGENSGIAWTEDTWNPGTGCDRVSPGCDHCYALKQAKRLQAMGVPGYEGDGNPETSGPGFLATMHPDRLGWPLRKTKPRLIFVNSMSDLFHDAMTDEFIADVWAVMAMSGHHTFQVLTKRHGRMRSLLNSEAFRRLVDEAAGRLLPTLRPPALPRLLDLDRGGVIWPLPNVWLGVSAEDHERACLRVPALLDTPAAVRWISAEPLLGDLDLRTYVHVKSKAALRRDGAGRTHVPMWSGLDWVVVGGESDQPGQPARPMLEAWASGLLEVCQEHDVPYFMKQYGHVLAREQGVPGKGENPARWPRPWPRDWPKVVTENGARA